MREVRARGAAPGCFLAPALGVQKLRIFKFIPVSREFSAPAIRPRQGQRASTAWLRAVPGQNSPSDSDPSATPWVERRPRGDPLRAAAQVAFHHPRQWARGNRTEPRSFFGPDRVCLYASPAHSSFLPE
uniref:Uncharacterized protein n=1 Tax=Rousettus aegyptiacus TaxID=9407 RepID=A0A7J8GAP2_ROUAE|nr:hypothetical protein HJG63_011614 [Rousettus aegyptiacus]